VSIPLCLEFIFDKIVIRTDMHNNQMGVVVLGKNIELKMPINNKIYPWECRPGENPRQDQ
jgi:hypothetical protein